MLSPLIRVPSCLGPGTALLTALKRKVVELASNACVLETIQRAAQECLPASMAASFEALPVYNAGASERFATTFMPIDDVASDGGLSVLLPAIFTCS